MTELFWKGNSEFMFVTLSNVTFGVSEGAQERAVGGGGGGVLREPSSHHCLGSLWPRNCQLYGAGVKWTGTDD